MNDAHIVRRRSCKYFDGNVYYKTVVHCESFFNAMAGSVSVSAVCGVSNSERAEYQKNMYRVEQKKWRQVQRIGLSFLDWLCIGRPSCLAALGREFGNRGHFFCTTLYSDLPRIS